MVADQVAPVAHLNVRDTTLVFVSRAPQADIARMKARMGWKMPWYTLTDSFDADFGVAQWHGTNAFIRDHDRVFRTYFVKDRGDEQMGNTWNYLDLTALGRQEEWEDSPKGYPQTPPTSGAALVKNLLDAGLIDELRLIVHPLLLGGGKSLFQGVKRRPRAEPGASGRMVLTYRT